MRVGLLFLALVAVGSLSLIAAQCPQPGYAGSPCALCPLGRTGGYPFNPSSTVCVDCVPGRAGAGYFADGTQPFENDPNTCRDCAPGRYAASGGLSACLLCAPGTISNALRTGCDDCPSGRFAPGVGSAECLPCGVGRWSNTAMTGPGLPGLTVCIDCQQGKYGTITGSTTSNDCVNCPANTYWTVPFRSRWFGPTATTCAACAVGKYSPAGSTCSTACVDPPATCPVGQRLNGVACEACSAGSASPGGTATVCAQCTAGKYAAAAASSCSDCAIGWTSPAGAASCTAITCSAGQRVNGAVCENCSAGTASMGGTATVCAQCTAGKYAAEAASSCSDCAIGWTSPAGAASCTGPAQSFYDSLDTSQNFATGPTEVPNGDELGMGFKVTRSGMKVTHIRFRRDSSGTTSQTVKLWTDNGLTGVELYSFIAENLVSGWNTVALPTPQPLVSETKYIISVYLPPYRNYLYHSITSVPFTAPAARPDLVATDVYGKWYGGNGYPQNTFNNGQYFFITPIVQVTA